MNSTTATAFVIASLLISARAASADCASELTSVNSNASLPLPAACRSLGPIHLGMVRAEVITVLGKPDRDITEPASLVMEYRFPRQSAPSPHRDSEMLAGTRRRAGVIRLVLVADKVVNIEAGASSSDVIPYTVGGISIGEPVPELLRRVRAKPAWNSTRDNILFTPYPIEVEVVPSKRNRVSRITIATRNALHDSYEP